MTNREKKPRVVVKRAKAKKNVMVQKSKSSKKNPYIKFCKKRREELKKENPTLKPKEITKKLNDEWNGMSEQEKDSYRPKKPTGPKKAAGEKEKKK